MRQLSCDRDILRFHIEYKAKEPFLKPFKGDMNNLQLSVDSTVWNALDNLEKAAYAFHNDIYAFHNDIKNFWKWVKKGLLAANADETSIKQQLFNVAFFFVSNNTEQLDKWKTALLAGNNFYYPLCF